MKIDEFREVLRKRSTLHPNDDFETEKCWRKEVAILSEDINGTISYLQNECTDDEYSWISEIIDDLIEVTRSKELLYCYKSLMNKFPVACETYNIAFSIECAEALLE